MGKRRKKGGTKAEKSGITGPTALQDAGAAGSPEVTMTHDGVDTAALPTLGPCPESERLRSISAQAAHAAAPGQAPDGTPSEPGPDDYAPLRVGEFLRYLAPDIFAGDELEATSCPFWPGDCFGLCAAILEKSSAYPLMGTDLQLFADFKRRAAQQAVPPGGTRPSWVDFLTDEAKAWRQSVEAGAPEWAKRRWQTIVGRARSTIDSVRNDPELCIALLELAALADETLSGVGLELGVSDPATRRADLLLRPGDPNGSTLCRRIHPSRVRVLPKSQTPRSGLSLRSLSHHVAFCPPVDVIANWRSTEIFPSAEPHCNLLLVPWPFEMNPSQFSALTKRSPAGSQPVYTDDGSVGWFLYSPASTPDPSDPTKSLDDIRDVARLVEKLVDEAERRVGRIHVVVFPELALNEQQYEHLCRVLLPREIGLIAGIYAAPESPDDAGHSTRVATPRVPDTEATAGGSPQAWGENYVGISLPSKTRGRGEAVDVRQNKHHRWRLCPDQITRYGLSAALDPSKVWWEGIRVSKREINFLRIRPWLSTCVLICEDLARLDPVGRFVRAVAPDLVIALLLDGPQLSNRWPAYHATVLTDDPGSSVLTLTAQGMTKLSRIKEKIGEECKPVVAMWRDAVHGLIEISIPDGKQAAVLTLTKHDNEERTADNRPHSIGLGFPVFGGMTFV